MKLQKRIESFVLPHSVKPLVAHLAAVVDAQKPKLDTLAVPVTRRHYVNGEGKQFVRELFERLGWKVSFKHQIDGMMAGAAFYGSGPSAGVNFPASAVVLSQL